MGKVQAPVAFSSSNSVDMIGKSFCLLSSLEMNPLSSCNTKRRLNNILIKAMTSVKDVKGDHSLPPE